jgi:hypothetical protein
VSPKVILQTFYSFLKSSFRGCPGLERILTEEFKVLNGYNGAIIHQNIWQLVIQPKAKINIAMVVRGHRLHDRLHEERCPTWSCEGRIFLSSINGQGIW